MSNGSIVPCRLISSAVGAGTGAVVERGDRERGRQMQVTPQHL